MREHKSKPYYKYSKKEKKHLEEKHHLQPCVYCGVLTDLLTCNCCGYREDKALEKVD